MKLIEALKKIKDLERKADDLCKLVQENCARSNLESDKYENQSEKVSGWIQSHSDILKEILHLRIAIQKTNLLTEVTIELGGKNVTKSIAAWIHRRRDLANKEFGMWNVLWDRGVREGFTKGPTGEEIDIKVVRHYSVEERDRKRDLLQSEPVTIDGKLEIANAVTDLIE